MKHTPPLLLLIACGLLSVHAETPFAVNPYTYYGRVMDAEHVAFDSNRVATVSAYDASGKLLARTTSVFRSTSRNNYCLNIPVAEPAVSGHAGIGDVLAVSAVDDDGVVWAGVLVDDGRSDGTVVGQPGGSAEVDIILGRDTNNDGLDDATADLYARTWKNRRRWEEDYDPNEEFDLSKDYDGDGVSTLDEILSGTDPFSSETALRITAFDRVEPAASTGQRAAGNEQSSDDGFAITFPAVGGHAYSLLGSTSLQGPWTPIEFSDAPGGVPVNVISYPNVPRSATTTVYLAPIDAPAYFFKVRCE